MTRCWKVESTQSGVGPREPRAVHLRSSRRPPRWTEWVHITLKSQEGKQHRGSGHTAAWGTRKRVRHRFWVCLWGVSARHEQSGPSREKGPHPHGRASPRPLRTPWQKHTKEGRFSLSWHVHLSCCSWFSGMHAACSSSLTHIQKVCKSLQRDNSIPTQEHPKILTQAILFWALGKSVLGKGRTPICYLLNPHDREELSLWNVLKYMSHDEIILTLSRHLVTTAIKNNLRDDWGPLI